jgi:hypothetical protein
MGAMKSLVILGSALAVSISAAYVIGAHHLRTMSHKAQKDSGPPSRSTWKRSAYLPNPWRVIMRHPVPLFVLAGVVVLAAACDRQAPTDLVVEPDAALFA